MYNCVWVCHCWTIYSICQVPSNFNLWIPLQAQTPLNNTKRLSENICQLIVTVKEWLCDLQFIGCSLLLLTGHLHLLLTASLWEGINPYRQLEGGSPQQRKSFRPSYHFLFSRFPVFVLSNNLSKPCNDKYYWETVRFTKQFLLLYLVCTLHINENSGTFHSC